MGVRPLLLPVPVGALLSLSRVFGMGNIMGRLCSSLQVDIGHARDLLGWSPFIPVDDGLAATASDFMRSSDS